MESKILFDSIQWFQHIGIKKIKIGNAEINNIHQNYDRSIGLKEYLSRHIQEKFFIVNSKMKRDNVNYFLVKLDYLHLFYFFILVFGEHYKYRLFRHISLIQNVSYKKIYIIS
jgi:hypothetical protein